MDTDGEVQCDAEVLRYSNVFKLVQNIQYVNKTATQAESPVALSNMEKSTLAEKETCKQVQHMCSHILHDLVDSVAAGEISAKCREANKPYSSISTRMLLMEFRKEHAQQLYNEHEHMYNKLKRTHDAFFCQ